MAPSSHTVTPMERSVKGAAIANVSDGSGSATRTPREGTGCVLLAYTWPAEDSLVAEKRLKLASSAAASCKFVKLGGRE